MTTSATTSEPLVEPITVERWPTEIPLLIMVVLASAGIWMMLALSIIGIVYVVLIGLFLFLGHVVLVARIRGSGVRLGPDQFPMLFRRVQSLAANAGIGPVPEAYLMEAGGTLNAFATKFLRSELIVLYTDLLEACGEDTAARDMVIGHELGHIRARHFRGLWFLMPGLMTPILGSLYSQAREYTCDRYGAALCGDVNGCMRGLAILAAGRDYGRRVNFETFAHQKKLLDTGLMTLGKWLSSYPPLCDRVAAIQPSSIATVPPSTRGLVRALAILGGFLLIPIVASAFFAANLLPRFRQAIEEAQTFQQTTSTRPQETVDIDAAISQIELDTAQLALLAEEYREKMGVLPADSEALYGAWRSLRSEEKEPLDPFDSYEYGYDLTEEGFVIWSSGPDGEPDTDDDIVKFFRMEGTPPPEDGPN